jgi:hypothetical protein
MFRINEGSTSNSTVKELRNHSSIIHEHDFVPIRAKEKAQKSIICLTCGSHYCDKCGKLLVTVHGKNYVQHNIYYN